MRWAAGCVLVFAFAGEARADVNAQCEADRARGVKLRSEHELRGAMYAFRACSAPECSDAVRDECANAYDAVAATLPAIVVTVRDARGNAMSGVHVVIDGREAAASHGVFVVDPGEHAIRVDGIDGVEQHVTLAGGDHKRIMFASPALEPRPLWRSPAWPWLVTSAGATAVVAGVLMTSVTYAQCGPYALGCSQSDTLKDLNHAGIGVLIGGAIVTAAGITWLVLHRYGAPKTLALARGALEF